jgi:hypothetical protein
MGGAGLATAISSPLGGQVGRGQRCPASKTAPRAAQNTQELAADIVPQPGQYRGMLGELEKQFSLTRVALSTGGRTKSKSVGLVLVLLLGSGASSERFHQKWPETRVSVEIVCSS